MLRIPFASRRLLLALPLTVLGMALLLQNASSQAYRNYKGLTPAQIVQSETALLGTYARTILPQCSDRAAAVEAVTWIVSEREMIGASLNQVYPLDQLDGIGASDAIDDSLARDFDMLAHHYVDAAGPASYTDTTGALSVFRDRITKSPGIGDIPVPYSTVAAVTYGRDALLAGKETGANVEATEDAFLRYVADIGSQYLAARATLRKRHLAEVRNEDWVLARLRCSECGAHDWDVGPLFMKIKGGTSDYYHTRDLTCRQCGKISTWDYFLPSFTLMNKLHTDRLPGEPADSVSITEKAQASSPQAPAPTSGGVVGH